MFKILEEVKDAKSIAISGHVRPDGDCIGATMGLYQFLRKSMPEANIQVYLEETPKEFAFIQGMDKIDSTFTMEDPYDIFIVCDCSPDRLGGGVDICKRAKKTINIDHHISNTGTCDVNYIVPTASSTSELIFDVIDENYLDIEMAKAIYIGIIHDTGVLKYSNTSPKTLNTVAKLIAFDFDFTKLIDQTFYEKTYAQNLILGRAILDSNLYENGKIIASTVTKEMMEIYGVTSKELDGIVNQLLITSGVECAIFLYQTGDQEYKVSMRSKEYMNVSAIAVAFGGGGHVRAAGCTISGEADEIIQQLLAYMK
ncbi:MAG: bifunctional oligoribonuclease/PAP phosphatase NrnA [Eubacteriales bacterium]